MGKLSLIIAAIGLLITVLFRKKEKLWLTIIGYLLIILGLGATMFYYI